MFNVMLPLLTIAQAADAAAPVAEATGKSSLAEIIAGVLGTLITLFLLPYLNKKKKEAEANVAKATADKTKTS
jgi:hypothetical protein